MLEHVGEHDRIGGRRQTLHGLEIRNQRLIEPAAEIGEAVGLIFESECAPEVITDRGAELAAGRAEVEENAAALRVSADETDQDPMAAALEILECVDVRHQSDRKSVV